MFPQCPWGLVWKWAMNKCSVITGWMDKQGDLQSHVSEKVWIIYTWGDGVAFELLKTIKYFTPILWYFVSTILKNCTRC